MTFAIGAADLLAALRRHELWRALAWSDIRRSHALTSLGALWHSISFLITVGLLGYMYSTFFQRDTDIYVPFLASGFLVWRFVSGLSTEGIRAVTSGQGLLSQSPLPISVFPLRLVCNHAYQFAFNVLAFVAILILFQVTIAPNPLLLIPGLAILVVAGVGTTLLLGVASVFQPWLQSFVPAIMGVTFFITPIIWMPGMLTGVSDGGYLPDLQGDIPARMWVLLLNPFYYFVEIVRAPLVGYTIPGWYWGVAITLTVLLFGTGLLLLSRMKSRILLNL